MKQINRREFLKLSFSALFPFVFRTRFKAHVLESESWPSLSIKQIPNYLREILAIVPNVDLDRAGILHLNQGEDISNPVMQVQTEWSIERDHFFDRLIPDQPWGIVLHWYGEGDEFDNSVEGYLRGFDSLRQVEEYVTRTSAHFLVGEEIPKINSETIGIIQTQKPYVDGIPTLASHIHELDLEGHLGGDQYFVRALYQLSFDNPRVHSVLQDWFDGPNVDPNDVSIAIEITGKEFHKFEKFPTKQKVANVVSVVWALMQRYQIPAINILGHNEIDLRKPDPGKEFLGLIRLLIGLKAIVENESEMNELVFGLRSDNAQEYNTAVVQYFAFIRNYLVLLATPKELFDWEALSKYWFVFDQVEGKGFGAEIADRFIFPIPMEGSKDILRNFDNEKHYGVDLICEDDEIESKAVRLISHGVCLHVNNKITGDQTRSAIFRHRLVSGAEIISIYSNLSSTANLIPGQKYSRGAEIGTVNCRHIDYFSYLRFSIAYAALWDTEFKERPYALPNVSADWIQRHFIEPFDFVGRINEISRLNKLIDVPKSAY